MLAFYIDQLRKKKLKGNKEKFFFFFWFFKDELLNCSSLDGAGVSSTQEQ